MKSCGGVDVYIHKFNVRTDSYVFYLHIAFPQTCFHNHAFNLSDIQYTIFFSYSNKNNTKLSTKDHSHISARTLHNLPILSIRLELSLK
jgi:hypothetical protein